MVDEASYCNSKKRPAFDAVGAVRDFVVVSVSNTKVARESFVDSGVDEKDSIDESRCERMVVLPEPDSPLQSQGTQHLTRKGTSRSLDDRVTYRKTTAWFSARPPSLDQALPAKSSASPMALPCLPPSGPLEEEV